MKDRDNADIEKLVNSTYEWFNQIMDPMALYQKEDLQELFTPDFIMELNGKVIVDNYDSLYEHFKKFREGKLKIRVNLPLEETFVSEDHQKFVAKYTIAKTSSVQGTQEIKVIAIWHLRDDRLSRMNEVVHFGEVKSLELSLSSVKEM